jgi:phytanoyl-CoA hydroxylase
MRRCDLREQLQRDGYIILEDFASEETCDSLRARADHLVKTLSENTPLSLFTTAEERRQTDDYFLGSGREISFFFEEDAIVDGQLTLPRDVACNKIGHALHDLDPLFDQFSRSASMRRLAQDIGFVDPLLIQSMYIFKNPQVGGRVDWHQDACFLHTDPLTVKGFWFALEEATQENGCLWVVPGGHTQGLKKRFVRGPAGETEFLRLDTSTLDVKGAIPLEVSPGALVVFDGTLPHFSAANRSSKRRSAYTLHLIERAAAYSADNWLQPTIERPWRGF